MVDRPVVMPSRSAISRLGILLAAFGEAQPVVIGVMFLLRARHTVAEDAQAIITAMLQTSAAAQREDAGSEPLA